MEEATTHSTNAPVARKRRNKPSRLVIISVVVLVFISAFLGWKYIEARREVKRLQNPQVAVKREADELKAKISQLVDLPDEQATVATVSDVNKLKNQQFFTKAQNGDKVLIFPTAARAVLYRPSTNKVIEYAPVNLGSTKP